MANKNKWPNRIVEYRPACPLDEFLDNERNWRIHPEAQRRGVVKILDRVGKVDALKAYHSERYGGLTFYDGHLRRDIDPNETWPVLIADLTDEEADFVIMTLDPSAGMADIDYSILDSLVEDAGPFDEDIASILATLNVELPEMEKPPLPDPGPQIDRAEELQEVWQVETGQVWRCGEHRIMCGDSTKSDDVERLLNGKEAAITITDPPYNVGINYGSGTMDNRSKIEYIAWSSKWLKHATHKKIFTVGIKRLTWWDEIAGEPQWIIAWIKRNGQGNTSLGGTNKWDAILLYNCPKDGGIDIIECNNDYSENIKASGGHPTAKPIELFTNLADRFTSISNIVYEPFCGTGTTIIACEQTGRIGYGMEIEPKYVAVCLQRFQDAFGVEPVLVR